MKKNTYEDRHKYIKMIEQGYSIDYICKHRSISHKDLEPIKPQVSERWPVWSGKESAPVKRRKNARDDTA